MGFDKDAFLTAKFEPRTDTVPVSSPELKKFFKDSEKPEWKVRGLSGVEIGKANDVADKNSKIRDILDGIAGHLSEDRIAAIKDLVAQDTPMKVARGLELLQLGAVDPEMDLEFALKVCAVAPGDYNTLVNKIERLSAMGHMPGKQ
ncbi:hypothetical protein LCGC14_2217270, partial [marine sediment metagenome]